MAATRVALSCSALLLLAGAAFGPGAQADPSNGCQVVGISPDSGARCTYVATGGTTYDAYTPQAFTITATYKDRRGRTQFREQAGAGEGTFQKSGTLASRRGDRITVVVSRYSGAFVPVTGWAGYVHAHDTK